MRGRKGGLNTNKKALEIALQGIAPHPNPSSSLEQYTTPAAIVADILFTSYLLGDIEGKKIVDLGCGTGIFALGAKLMGADKVIGVDIDDHAISVAKNNADSLGLNVVLMTCDVSKFKEQCDTVIQNPPFGSQRRHADIPFLEKALEIGEVVYSIHNLITDRFIKGKVSYLGAEITHEKEYKFEIRHMFSFHTSEKKEFDVKMYRFKGKVGGKI
jgi:putative methylase